MNFVIAARVSVLIQQLIYNELTVSVRPGSRIKNPQA